MIQNLETFKNLDLLEKKIIKVQTFPNIAKWNSRNCSNYIPRYDFKKLQLLPYAKEKREISLNVAFMHCPQNTSEGNCIKFIRWMIRSILLYLNKFPPCWYCVNCGKSTEKECCQTLKSKLKTIIIIKNMGKHKKRRNNKLRRRKTNKSKGN